MMMTVLKGLAVHGSDIPRVVAKHDIRPVPNAQQALPDGFSSHFLLLKLQLPRMLYLLDLFVFYCFYSAQRLWIEAFVGLR